MQHIHDHAARHGAVCDKKNAMFVSSHERAGMQTIHDHAVEHGAKCSGMPEGTRSGPGGAYYFSTDDPNPKGSDVSTETKTAATEPNAQVASTVNFADTPEFKAAIAETERLKTKIAEFTAAEEAREAKIRELTERAESERRAKQAHEVAAFVKDAEFPRALHGRLCEVLSHAREHDHKATETTANFTASDNTSKVTYAKALEELLLDLKKAVFTQHVAGHEQLPAGHRVLANEGDSTTAVFTEAKKVLGLTDTGKKYLAANGGKFDPETVQF
jgi:hypothetical protein